MRIFNALGRILKRWRPDEQDEQPDPKKLLVEHRKKHPFALGTLRGWPTLAKRYHAQRKAWQAVKPKYNSYRSKGEYFPHRGDDSEFQIGKQIYRDTPRGFRKAGIGR